MKNDMTVGSPLKKIILFAIPIILSNLFQQLYNIADTLIVGRTLGASALAAVGASGNISWLILGFSTGICSGMCIITSQRIGAKDERGVRDSFAVGIFVSAIVSVLLTAIAVPLTRPLLMVMNTPDDIIDEAGNYALTFFYGLGATVFYNYFASVLRALGDSRTPFVILIISSVINIILDYVFIIYTNMGVSGAALATVIAQILSCVISIIYMLKKYPMLRLSRQNWHINRFYMWAHIKLGLPMSLQYTITTIGSLISTGYINKLGTTVLSALAVSGKITMIMSTVLGSFGSAVVTYSAQNVGAGNFDRVKQGVKRSTWLSFSVIAIGSALLVVFSQQLVHLFVGLCEPEIESMVFTYTVCAIPGFIAYSIIIIYRSTLQSLGETMLPFIYGFVELAVYILVSVFLTDKFGYIIACIVSPLAWASTAILLFLTYIVYMRKHHGTAFKVIKKSA